MKEFIMVYRNAPMGDFAPTPEQVQAIDKQWGDWFAGTIAQGKHDGGYRLGPEGKTARPGIVVTDGPLFMRFYQPNVLPGHRKQVPTVFYQDELF